MNDNGKDRARFAKISIIVPVYNAEKYIAETLEAIRTQSFTDFDVHIVDDCSNDSSPSIIREFCSKDDRFAYYRAPSNFGGPAGPRNIGIQRSDSEYIAFCDADDIWAKHKLETQLEVAELTSAKIIAASIRDFKDSDIIIPFAAPSRPISYSNISHSKLLLKNWIALSTVLVEKKAFLRSGAFNEAKDYVAVEDYDMWVRMTGDGARAIRIEAPLVHYRKLATSISASKSMMVSKALVIIGEDYRRRNLGWLYKIIKPIHWLLYVGTSIWMRTVKREL